MPTYLDKIFGSRFWALISKEVAQLLHNRQLLIQLLVPPTVFLILFGFALNPTFTDLQVGITDYSSSRYSREFIELFNQTDAFVINRYYTDQKDMLSDLTKGNMTVGVIIPPEFDRDLALRRSTQVQAVFDAVDANTANVASSYLSELVSDYNLRRSNKNLAQEGTRGLTSPSLGQNQVQLETSVLYNPGLDAAWFIVPGMIGILMTTLGSQVAASLVVREKEAGTLEQLMITPVSNTQVILAKICPLLVFLTFDATVAIIVGRLVFDLPFRGNFFLFISISILYFFVGISIGIIIATYAKSEQQAQLSAFFINPPLLMLAGATFPITAMPTAVQLLTYLDPMRYYIEVCRGIILKGVGLETLWHQVLILFLFAIVLTTLSIRQFRHQLS